MIDGFIIFTPVLLLAVIALLGFVGCDTVFGIHSTGLLPANQVAYVNTVVYVNGTGTTSLNAVLSGLQGGELIVIALQWKGNPPAFNLNLTSVFGPHLWQLTTSVPPKILSDIQVFTAINPDGQTQFTVGVTLNSVVSWSICLSAYKTVDASAPTYSYQPAQVTTSANNPVTNLSTSPIGLTAGDALYAVAFAADGNGNLTLAANNLKPGPGFTLDNPGATNPLVEHVITDNFGGNQSLPAVVVNNAGNPVNLFALGMGIKSLPL